MGMIFNICLLCLVVVLQISKTTSLIDDDLESVIIEASNEPQTRNSRQILVRGPLPATAGLPLSPYSPFLMLQPDPNSIPLATTGPCFTNKGVLGKCTSFRQCYPYFKLPDLNNWDSWILGMYDTCSYYTAQGRQVFGVCCTNPIKPMTESPTEDMPTTTPSIEPEDNEEAYNITRPDGESPKRPQYYPNWPPPIPTHPPDHTIPPLPTHPPSPGFPPTITTPKPTAWPPTISPPTAWPPTSKPPSVWPPTSKPPAVWPPTSKPPIASWPPTSKPPTAVWPPTSKPPTWPPTTSKPPSTAIPPVLGDTASCGAKNGYQDQERIVGGHNADVNEWPWIAALFNGGRQFCGGSLIDNIHILSAAHCVAHMSSWDVARLTVRLADHNIKTNTETRHVEKRVKRVVRHRGFDSRTLYNDIAILTLDSPVQFTSQIRPVCLPSGVRDYAGHTGTVIGWGSLRESGPQPAILQEVNIPIWSNRDCKLKYGPAAPGGIVEHMLCAGQASKDSCSGDSGGPLMVNTGRWTQVGIVSWGIGCGKGQYPGVYTRVEKFLPWIYKNLK